MAPRDKQDTREALIGAALQVFVLRGFARATTREIAQTAGVAEGTIYRHFPDKQALFHDVFSERLAEMAQELDGLKKRAGRDTLRHNLAHVIEQVGAMQEQLAALMGSMWADPDLARRVHDRTLELSPEGFVPPSPVKMVADYLREEQALGRVRSDVEPEQAAALVVSLPLAAGMERALRVRQLQDAPGFPAVEPFPADAGGALDVLIRGLDPGS